jgi:hypothetical protein
VSATKKRMPARDRGFRARLVAVTRRQQRDLKLRREPDAWLTPSTYGPVLSLTEPPPGPRQPSIPLYREESPR